MVKDMVPHDFPVTLGRDFGRVVEPVGDGVTGVSAGDEVFGFVPAIAPTVHAGAWAELIAVPEAGIRRKPDGVDTAAALAAVTAVLCVDALDLSQGDTMPIAGAAGEGRGRTNVVAARSSEILARIAQHLADGTLEVPVQHTYDFVPAPEAMQALGATHTQGELARRGA
jgi:NADPH:quinone reductase-like Zn-dependent oxidoreductase